MRWQVTFDAAGRRVFPDPEPAPARMTTTEKITLLNSLAQVADDSSMYQSFDAEQVERWIRELREEALCQTQES